MSLSQYTTQTTGNVASSTVAVLGASSPVGGLIATGMNVLEALGISIRGKTQHLSYEQVLSPAVDFGLKLWQVFDSAYSDAELAAIARKVPARFNQAMQERWGMAASLNQTIYNDINTNYMRKNELNRQMALFYIWVGTNVDAESATEMGVVLDAYFVAIFLAAVSDAGLSAGALKGNVTVPMPGDGTYLPPGDATGTNPPNATAAGSKSVLALLALAGAGYFLLKKKGGA